MALIDRYTIKSAIDSGVDIASFGAIGYCCGHVMNSLSAWGSGPSFLNHLEKTDLHGVTVCCALFITIDRLVHGMMHILSESHEIDKPFYTAVRIAVNGLASIQLFNLLAPGLNLSTVKTKPAAVVMITALVIYTHLMMTIAGYNNRP